MSLAHDLARKFGGDIHGDYVAIPTPVGAHSKRDRGTIIRDRADGRGVHVYSFNADWRAVRDALGLTDQQVRPMSQEERRRYAQERAKQKAHREAAQLKWAGALAGEANAPEPGGPVRAYLAARGIAASTAAQAVASGALREHYDAYGRVSMLALAHDNSGAFRAVQMTKLRRDGSAKRGDTNDRFTFGPFMGSACRLFPLAGDTLAVSEGTETGLAFYALRGVPTWALFGTANLAAFTPPARVKTLIIAADGDRAQKPGEIRGLDAAEKLFDRLKGKLRCILAPAPDDFDWLDVLNHGGESCR